MSVSVFLPVNFARLRLKLFGLLQSSVGLFPPRRRVIESKPVKVQMCFAQQAVSEQKIRIAPDSFLEQADGLEQTSLGTGIVYQIPEGERPHIKIVREDVVGRRLLDGGF